jgi:hypothetical protein
MCRRDPWFDDQSLDLDFCRASKYQGVIVDRDTDMSRDGWDLSDHLVHKGGDYVVHNLVLPIGASEIRLAR